MENNALQKRQRSTKSVSDQRIRLWIRLAGNGDHEAFRNIVQTYEKRVLAVAYRITGNEDDAKDVAQEVFIRLYRFLSKFNPKKCFFTWLYRITVNAGYDCLKKRNRYQAMPLEKMETVMKPQTMNPESESDIRGILYELTNILSTAQKTALILRDFEGFSCQEIAKIMDCPEGTVRSHLHYARKRLKEIIETYYPEFLQ